MTQAQLNNDYRDFDNGPWRTFLIVFAITIIVIICLCSCRPTPKPVLHMMEDTSLSMPDSQCRVVKIIPHPFVEKEMGRISISGSGITEITGDIDAMRYCPTLSNHWTIPDLW